MRNVLKWVASRTAQLVMLFVITVLVGFTSNQALGYTTASFKGLPVVWSGQCAVNDPHCPDESGAATVGAERWRERMDNPENFGDCYAYTIGLSDALVFNKTGPATDVSLNYGLAGNRSTNMMDALILAGIPAKYVRSWWVQRSNEVGQRFQGVAVLCKEMLQPNALARQILEQKKADMLVRVQVAVKDLPSIDPSAAMWAITGNCGGVVKFSSEGGWTWPTQGQKCSCEEEIPLNSTPWDESQKMRSQVPTGTVATPAWKTMVCVPPNLVWDLESKACREPYDAELLLGAIKVAHVSILNSQDFTLTTTAMKRLLGERFSQVGTYGSTGFVEYRVESTCQAYDREVLADQWDNDFKFRLAPLFMGSVLGGNEWTSRGNGAGFGGTNLELGVVLGNGHYAGLLGVGGSAFYRDCDDTGEVGVEGLLGFRLGSGNRFGFSAVYTRYEGMVFKPDLINESTGETTAQSGRTSVRNAIRTTLDIHPTDKNWFVGLGLEGSARVQTQVGSSTSMYGLAPVLDVGVVGWKPHNPYRDQASWR